MDAIIEGKHSSETERNTTHSRDGSFTCLALKASRMTEQLQPAQARHRLQAMEYHYRYPCTELA